MKKIFIVLTVLLLVVAINLKIYAMDDIMQGADNFLEEGKNSSILNADSIKKISNNLFDIFLTAGIAVVLIVGAVLGIKFITGSVAEKAQIKESLTPYIIGAIVIFGAVGIWSLALNIVQGIF